MFERNKIDNTGRQQGVAVELTLSDGRVLKGKLAIPMSKSLFDALNSDGSFVEFMPYKGEREYIAKSALRSVRLTEVPPVRALQAPANDRGNFDPHLILGLSKGASADESRQAFHRLAMLYHPDRYATAELPNEVVDYLEAMSRRVNTAYGLLEENLSCAQKFSQERAASIYQSRGPN